MTEQQNTEQQQPQEEKANNSKRRKVLGTIAIIFVLLGAGWYAYDRLVLAYEAETEDAYVNGDQISISSRSNGTVTAVYADNTDLVKKGQLLVKLDPVDTQVQLAQAKAKLGEAVRQAQASIAQANEADAAVVQNKASYDRALADYQRREPLLAQRAAAKEDVDSARRQMEAAKAAYEQAKASARAAHVAVDGMTVKQFPSVEQAKASYVSAWIDNKRHVILAPADGYVAKRNVQVGQHIQAGQTLLTVVPLHHTWIDANFKETQIAHLRVGQPVTIEVDAHSDMTYHGKVQGLAAGTGSVFSLLPAENATGNWIKVIQRLPVRIAIDQADLDKKPLQLGLSTTVTVDTHDRSGAALATKAVDQMVMGTDIYQGQLAAADADAQSVINANLVAND
ncbi:efflux RND transporter periplasmic adaptor subunit [Gallaecimonas mangrovi]|uniref:efflux RND transporter periplasmic adaptor subunit n=1 Tax=Gallaecimonas mangrovi TaxID=2291597 RepID=UPI000E1FDDBE|nr:HlyD family efflux transporter periplasmic adaptor subunit [Gallaecimonas mangrovi]